MNEKEKIERQLKARQDEAKVASDEMNKRTGRNLTGNELQEFNRWKAMLQNAVVEIEELERKLAELKN